MAVALVGVDGEGGLIGVEITVNIIHNRHDHMPVIVVWRSWTNKQDRAAAFGMGTTEKKRLRCVEEPGELALMRAQI